MEVRPTNGLAIWRETTSSASRVTASSGVAETASSTNVTATNLGAQWRYNGLFDRTASSFNTQSVWQAKIGVRYKF